MAIGTVVAISVGVTMGLINGTLITRLRLAPFIATLGTMGFTAGGTLVINGGREIDRIPSQWSELGNSVLAGWFPFPINELGKRWAFPTVAACLNFLVKIDNQRRATDVC